MSIISPNDASYIATLANRTTRRSSAPSTRGFPSPRSDTPSSSNWIELAQSRQLTLSCGALEEALAPVDYLKAVIAHLLRVDFALTDLAKRSQQVLEVIREEPGALRGRR